MVVHVQEMPPWPQKFFIVKRRPYSQAGRRGFESRLPLNVFNNLAYFAVELFVGQWSRLWRSGRCNPLWPKELLSCDCQHTPLAVIWNPCPPSRRSNARHGGGAEASY